MKNPVYPSIDRIEMSPGPQSAGSDRFVLSLDGGGMRGIISTAVLEEFTDILRSMGFERPVGETFDMVAGTSTGGLIACALTCPSILGAGQDGKPGLVSLHRLASVYLEHGEEIFADPVHGIRSTFTDKYSVENLERLLMGWYGAARFSDCVLPTLIMGYDVTEGTPFPMASTQNTDMATWEVCRCTSAAPTYFAPFNHEGHLIVDGGVVANNPSLYAYQYARSMWPDSRRIHILSVGTGSAVYRYKSMASYGISSWTGVHKVFASAQMQTVDETMQFIPDALYTRIYRELDSEIEMDDASEASLRTLQDFGRELGREFRPQLEQFARALVASKSPEPSVPQEISTGKPGLWARLRSWLGK